MSEKKSFWTSIPRILTGIAAIIAAVGGLYQIGVFSTRPAIQSSTNSSPSGVPPQRESSLPMQGDDTASVNLSTVKSSIHYKLGDETLSGRVVVYINGQQVGILTVGESQEESVLEFTVPHAGPYNYSIQGIQGVKVYFGEPPNLEVLPHTTQHSGRGIIEIESGKKFLVWLGWRLEGRGSGTPIAELRDMELHGE